MAVAVSIVVVAGDCGGGVFDCEGVRGGLGVLLRGLT